MIPRIPIFKDDRITADDIGMPLYLLPIAKKHHRKTWATMWVEHEECHTTGEYPSCIFCCIGQR